LEFEKCVVTSFILSKLVAALLFVLLLQYKTICDPPSLYDRPGGKNMSFLSKKTLHVVDKVLWMLPFVTNTDLNDSAMKADVSHESRNGFLQKLLEEHSHARARKQLKDFWAA
jgi:hypothetical protein